MKVQQPKCQYNPITIKLEKRSEANALFNLVNKLEAHRCNDGHDLIEFTDDEITFLIKLSNARYDGDIVL